MRIKKSSSSHTLCTISSPQKKINKKFPSFTGWWILFPISLLLLLLLCLICVLWSLLGTQGVVDWHSSAEHCGGTLQSSSFPGACSVPLWDWIPQRLWRSQNRGTGVKYTLVGKHKHIFAYIYQCSSSCTSAHFAGILQLSVRKSFVFWSIGSEAAGHLETHDVTKAQRRCWEELGTQTGDYHWG